jgi:hypothetical protein
MLDPDTTLLSGHSGVVRYEPCVPENPGTPERLGEEQLPEVLGKTLDGGVLCSPGQLRPYASHYQGAAHELINSVIYTS